MRPLVRPCGIAFVSEGRARNGVRPWTYMKALFHEIPPSLTCAFIHTIDPVVPWPLFGPGQTVTAISGLRTFGTWAGGGGCLQGRGIVQAHFPEPPPGVAPDAHMGGVGLKWPQRWCGVGRGHERHIPNAHGLRPCAPRKGQGHGPDAPPEPEPEPEPRPHGLRRGDSIGTTKVKGGSQAVGQKVKHTVLAGLQGTRSQGFPSPLAPAEQWENGRMGVN